MKRSSYLFVLVLVIATSCSQDVDFTQYENKIEPESLSHRIPLKEALNYAERHFEALYGTSTRTANRTSQDVQLYSPLKTRTTETCEGF